MGKKSSQCGSAQTPEAALCFLLKRLHESTLTPDLAEHYKKSSHTHKQNHSTM